MTRTLIAAFMVLSLAGCVNTPATKALITPIGGVGIHSFAPRDSHHIKEVNPDLMAKIDGRSGPVDEQESP